MKRQPRDSILKKKLHNENQSTMKTQTDIGENPLKSDGVDEMEDVSRTQVWDIPRTGIRSGGRLMEIVKQRADKLVIGYLRQRGIRRNSQWDFPRRRALFTSDGTYSISSESDTSEGHEDRPPEGQYETGRRTEERQDEDGVEKLGFPHETLERAVTQLQKELDDCRDHEKTDAGTGGKPPTAKTGKIYLDPSPEILGKI